jgi:site-specific DNA recombinase
VVRQVFDMALAGNTAHQIAVKLNAANVPSKEGSRWHPLTVKRLLANECYPGKTYYGKRKRISKTKVTMTPREQWIELSDVTPAIISEDIFKRAQDALTASRGRRVLNPKAAYLLTGFVRCSKCGSPVGGSLLGRRYRYYRCRGTAPTYKREKVCNCGYIKAEELESQVWKLLVRMFTSPGTIICDLLRLGYDSKNDVLPLIEAQIEKLRMTVKACDKREQELYPVLSNEAYNHDLVLDALNKVKAKRSEAEKEIAHLEAEKANATIARKVTLKLTEIAHQHYSELLNEPSFERKRELFDALNVRVMAEPGSFKFTCLIDTELKSEDFNDELDQVFHGALLEFEKQYPEYTLEDLINYDKTLPEDTIVGRVLNQVKSACKADFATIERTSALSHAHSYPLRLA